MRSKMMDVCGEAESRLATELMQHELQIERDILDPLNHMAEVKKTQTLSHSEKEALNKTRKIVRGVRSKVNMAFGSSLCCTEFSRLRCYPQC